MLRIGCVEIRCIDNFINLLIVLILLLITTGCDAEMDDRLFLPKIVATGSPVDFAVLENEAQFEEISKFVYGRGQNLAHAAVENRKYPTVLRLLKRAGVNLDHQDDDGRTPLHCAIDANRFEAARILIELGASLAIQNEAGYSPLLFCSEVLKSMPDHETCEFVLKSSAD